MRKGADFDYEILWSRRAALYIFRNGKIKKLKGLVCRVRSPRDREKINFYEGDSPAYAQSCYGVSEIPGIVLYGKVWVDEKDDDKPIGPEALIRHLEESKHRYEELVRSRENSILTLKSYIADNCKEKKKNGRSK